MAEDEVYTTGVECPASCSWRLYTPAYSPWARLISPCQSAHAHSPNYSPQPTINTNSVIILTKLQLYSQINRKIYEPDSRCRDQISLDSLITETSLFLYKRAQPNSHPRGWFTQVIQLRLQESSSNYYKVLKLSLQLQSYSIAPAHSRNKLELLREILSDLNTRTQLHNREQEQEIKGTWLRTRRNQHWSILPELRSKGAPMDWIELTLRPPIPPPWKPLTPDQVPPNKSPHTLFGFSQNPSSTPVTSNRRNCLTLALTRDQPLKEPWEITKRWPEVHRRREERRERHSDSQGRERERYCE